MVAATQGQRVKIGTLLSDSARAEMGGLNESI